MHIHSPENHTCITALIYSHNDTVTAYSTEGSYASFSGSRSNTKTTFLPGPVKKFIPVYPKHPRNAEPFKSFIKMEADFYFFMHTSN